MLTVALFAARREEASMLLFVEKAMEAGATVEEMAELISSAIISRGIPTWLSGIEAITKAMTFATASKVVDDTKSTLFTSEEACIRYYETEFEQVPQWVQYLIRFAPEVLLTYSNIRTVSLKDGVVPRKLKELLLYAINICDAYEKGIAIHETNAVLLGATEQELQEVRTLCIYAVGFKAML